MKICWDMIDGMNLSKLGNLRKGKAIYIEKDHCEVCGDPFLMNTLIPSVFCGNVCAQNSIERREAVLERWQQNSNLVDQKFNKLTVISLSHMTPQYHYMWNCLCECGNTCIVSTGGLKTGGTKSCGCLKIEASRESIKNLHKSGKEASHYNPNLTNKDRNGREHISGYGVWRRKVYELDFWTCRKCGYNGKDICAHHIEGFRYNPKLRLEISNGITLCKECHSQFHKLFGYGNNTRAQLVQFFK